MNQSGPDTECPADLQYARAAIVEAQDSFFQLGPCHTPARLISASFAILAAATAQLYALRFALTFVELPFRRKPDPIQAVATKAAMKDAGVAWLMEAIVSSVTKGHSSDEQA